ncbi:MAG: type IV toxin-antitoxin system AbiEi family antitoxin domain-containing protein [Lewinellaceae bacterium]|nr:type IV toxin-antitoxin system AbiEi family antitoxin domain-containing protein [Lewinellaceae bacterium]
MKNKLDIKQLFESNHGVLTINQLQDRGVTYYALNKLIKANKVERVKPGLYRWTDFIGDELFEALKIVPNGIICMYSAAAFFELTTFIPSQIHIAIPKKRKIRLPDYPPIKLYYWSESQLSCGQEQIKNNLGNPITIYNKEKVVCDFIKFRSKTGQDLSKEVLKNYLNREDRNITKLMAYARELNINSPLKKYLEVLL